MVCSMMPADCAGAYAARELEAWHAEHGAGAPSLRHADTAPSPQASVRPCAAPCALCAADTAGVVLTSSHDGRQWCAELTGADGYTIGWYAAGSYATLARFLVAELAPMGAGMTAERREVVVRCGAMIADYAGPTGYGCRRTAGHSGAHGRAGEVSQ
jgi:hypothetical protein